MVGATDADEATGGVADDSGDAAVPPPALGTAHDAQLAVQLAEAYTELGELALAERAYLVALPALEDVHGCTDGAVLDVWAQLQALRMTMGQHERAAADGQHVLNMLTLTCGAGSAELIPAAERLAKAHVLARRWPAARNALGVAHAIASSRFGAEQRDTLRIADVLKSLERYAPPRGSTA